MSEHVVEAAKQIRGKIVDLTNVSLDYRDPWLENIIQAAIEKAMQAWLCQDDVGISRETRDKQIAIACEPNLGKLAKEAWAEIINRKLKYDLGKRAQFDADCIAIIQAVIEKAWKDGYAEGYNNGFDMGINQ